MQRGFPDNSQWFTWNGSRKEKQGTHTIHKHLIGTPASGVVICWGYQKGINRYQKGSCSSLGPASILTQLSQGLDQESHQAADSLGQKNPGFDRERHWAAPQRAYWYWHSGWDWEGSTGWTVGLALLAASDSKCAAWVRFPHISNSTGNNKAWAHGAVGCELIAKGCR